MSRHKLREQIFKLLFRVGYFEDDELDEQLGLFLGALENVSDADKQEIEAKYKAVLSKLGEADEIIERNAKDWSISRIGKVEMAILRLAVFEMKYDNDVPVAVAINEAVDLVKEYGEDASGSFINGVLSGVAKEINADG